MPPTWKSCGVDMNDTKQVRIYLDRDTREQIAQLRSSYDAEDIHPCSLAQIISDAVEIYHHRLFSAKVVPGNWEDFLSSKGH